ncbi:acyltransferase family protein [Proteus terrae]|uniref:acyltransferase family protein n=1 Tax=Proteus terrae TaxID=1574161 RepID=UPI00384B1570
MQSKKFRADINGLRAIAVLSVMFFHFNQGLVPGGFAGVDVFFVISGFLMTSIIFRGLENNSFSLWNFLKARARRIVPALLTVVLFVLTLGYLFLEPMTYKLVGEHGFSSLLFTSNITYANESGYFDADSSNKIFLHTWSLSVEWQFYILYPIVLLALSKLLSIKTLRKVVLISAILSFSFCAYYSSINQTLSYFMIYTRAWEMLLGGVAFLFPLSISQNKKRIIELLGLLLILSSFFIFSDTDLWPSYNAFLPVFGAYLCILSNNSKTLLSNIALQKIGLWSYSIYLIHWPFIVFFKKINIEISIFTYFVSTVLLAFIMYYFVERKRNYYYGLIIVYIISLSVSYFISINGIASRIDNKNDINYHKEYYGGVGIPNTGKIERFNNTQEVKFILVGDSLARQYANFFKDKGIGFIGIFQDGCFSMEGYHNIYDKKLKNKCIARFESLKLSIKNNPNAIVIIAQRWDDKLSISENNDIHKKYKGDYINEYIKQIREISSSDVYTIGLANGTDKNVFECINNSALPIYKFVPFLSSCTLKEKEKEIIINDKIKNISDSQNIKYININDFLCNKNKCIVVDDKGNPIYSDNRHLSIYGAQYVGNKILYILDTGIVN